MKLILIDESKASKYFLCAVELDVEQAHMARQIVGGTRQRGQRSVHFVNESDRRRKELLEIYLSLPMRCTIYLARGLKEIDARSLCLEGLIENLRPEKNYKLILDRDQNHERNDRRVIREALQARQMLKLVDYEHQEPQHEQLLWLPDALGWANARGGSWRKRLRDFNIREKVLA